MTYYSIAGYNSLGQINCDLLRSSQCDTQTGICYDAKGCPMVTDLNSSKKEESSLWEDITGGLKDVVDIVVPVAGAIVTIDQQRNRNNGSRINNNGSRINNGTNNSQVPVIIQQPAATSSTPSWLLPVSIVAGVGMVGLIAVLALKR